MTTQISKLEVIETIAQIKGWGISEIKNLDMGVGTFQKGKCIYSFDLTSKGTMVKAKSIKFLWTAENFENCSY
jgi:hypothetical protein